jgi:phytoene synthase
MSAATDYCEALVRGGDKDRFLATLFAPQSARPALFSLYAFDLETARIGALVHEPMAGEIRLQWWHDIVTGQGDAGGSPVATALRDTITEYSLPPDQLTALIEARRFDAHRAPMQSLDEFARYANETAGAICSLAARILSPDADVGALSRSAGFAQRAADALIHLSRDASRGSVFIPDEILQRHGAAAADVLSGRATSSLQAALAELAGQAVHALADAKRELTNVPEAVHAAFLPLAIARALLARFDANDPFREAEISAWRRQWILWRASHNLPGAL